MIGRWGQWLAAAALALSLGVVAADAAETAVLSPVLDGVHWGESAAALRQHFGGRALSLAPPIEFADAYVDVALRRQMIAGYGFAVYYEMGRASHTLVRIMLERGPHGANPAVFRAVAAALRRDYGAPAQSCTLGASAANGYQAVIERLWRLRGVTMRAVYRDTTLAAAEGCVRGGTGACGATAHLYVQVLPGAAPCQ